MKVIGIIIVVIIVIVALFLIVWKYRRQSMGYLAEDNALISNNAPTPSGRQGRAAHNGTSGTLEENEGSALSFSPPAYDEVAGQNRTPGSVGQNGRSNSSTCNSPRMEVTGTQDSSGPSVAATQGPGGQTSNPPTYEEAISMTDPRF